MLRVLIKNLGNYSAETQEEINIVKDNKENLICPNCSKRVIFVDATFKIKHFRHQVESNCETEPETQRHIEMKRFFYEKYRNYESILEYKIGNNIADVFIKKLNIAIEVQHSNISYEEFISRNKEYFDNNIFVLWIFDENLITENIKIIFKEAKKMYFGRIYIYKPNKIIPLYFKTLTKWIDNGFDDSYLKYYKRKKKLVYGEKIINFSLLKLQSGEYKIARFYDKFIE